MAAGDKTAAIFIVACRKIFADFRILSPYKTISYDWSTSIFLNFYA
jgi:hypothetical protein